MHGARFHTAPARAVAGGGAVHNRAHDACDGGAGRGHLAPVDGQDGVPRLQARLGRHGRRGHLRHLRACTPASGACALGTWGCSAAAEPARHQVQASTHSPGRHQQAALPRHVSLSAHKGLPACAAGTCRKRHLSHIAACMGAEASDALRLTCTPVRKRLSKTPTVDTCTGRSRWECCTRHAKRATTAPPAIPPACKRKTTQAHDEQLARACSIAMAPSCATAVSPRMPRVPCAARLRGEDGQRKDAVGQHAGADDQRALGDGPVLQQVGVVRGEGLRSLWVVVRECHIAAQRYCSQRVLHPLALRRRSPVSPFN